MTLAQEIYEELLANGEIDNDPEFAQLVETLIEDGILVRKEPPPAARPEPPSVWRTEEPEPPHSHACWNLQAGMRFNTLH